MSYISRHRPVHAERLERFLGKEKLESLQRIMTQGGGVDAPGHSTGPGWYADPIYLVDLPGNIWIAKDGDFRGNLPFGRGSFASAWDQLADHLRKVWKEVGRQYKQPVAAAGFASISDALARASSGNRVYPNGGPVTKTGVTGVAGSTNTLWNTAGSPAAGAAGSAAPGGRIPTSATTGGMPYTNPASGTLHLTGADFAATVAANCLLLYDRLFDVAKTMSSTATEAVTGDPTRYTSTTSTAQDYIGGNFLFIEALAALGATAHAWTTCLYNDQANASSTLPSVTGNASNIINRLDQPAGTWFCPLESGDVGIKDLTQMQCNASVTGTVTFAIGHALGFMSFPNVGSVPFDWLTNKDQAPRIFDNACLALMELIKPATTATTYSGFLTSTIAAP